MLDSANTTTASPIDLSSDLTSRVKRVMSVHPEMIVPQASFYPFVTCYILDKPIERDDIAKDQLSAKRQAKIDIEVVGAVFNQNVTSVDKDPADTDINYLMENVELVLRSDPSLGGLVKWQRPQDIKYYTTMFDAQTHIRAGILRLQASVFY
jgi:hypothetical protein